MGELGTHLSECTCGGKLVPVHKISATLIDISGCYECSYTSQRCTSNDCKCTYAPNFLWDGNTKINTASPDDLTSGVLFITSKTAYTTRFLEYHSKLLYRGSLSASSQVKSFAEVLDTNAMLGGEVRAQMNLGHALFYWLTLNEFYKINEHTNIVLEDEISDKQLRKYADFMHQKKFPPAERDKVLEIIGDGHEKVFMKCSDCTRSSGRGGGRGGKKPGYANGWFMIVDPATKKVLAMVPQLKPENNAIVTEALKRILSLYPKCNCFIYDRNCQYQKTGWGPHASLLYSFPSSLFQENTVLNSL